MLRCICLSIVCFIKFSVFAQKNDTIILAVKYSKNNFGYAQLYIKPMDFKVPFVDTISQYKIIDKGVIHLQNGGSKMKIPASDSSDIENKFVFKVKNDIFILMAEHKFSGDTLLFFSNDFHKGLDEWKKIKYDDVSHNILDFITTDKINYLMIDDMEFMDTKTRIKMPIYFAPLIDNYEKSLLKKISILTSYYTTGTLKLGEERYHIYLKDRSLQYFFNEMNTGIKIVLNPQDAANANLQFNKIGDTINIGNKRIVFKQINYSADTLIYSILPNERLVNYGFNEGYKPDNIYFLDINTGRDVNMDSLLLKKDFVILDFWGTWCAPCIAGVPKLRNVANTFKKNIDVISIACENNFDISKVSNANKKYKMTWYNYVIDRKKYLEVKSPIYQFNVTEFPTFF